MSQIQKNCYLFKTMIVFDVFADNTIKNPYKIILGEKEEKEKM